MSAKGRHLYNPCGVNGPSQSVENLAQEAPRVFADAVMELVRGASQLR